MFKYLLILLAACSCSSLCPDTPKCRSLTASETDLLSDALTMAMNEAEIAEDNMLRIEQRSAALSWAKEREAIRKMRDGLTKKVLVCDDEAPPDKFTRFRR